MLELQFTNAEKTDKPTGQNAVQSVMRLPVLLLLHFVPRVFYRCFIKGRSENVTVGQ